jgi:hypothetical protein
MMFGKGEEFELDEYDKTAFDKGILGLLYIAGSPGSSHFCTMKRNG